ncbi:SDR family oxidoreductase [Leptospira ellisii]|uniref:SDR family oxidoreductase n=1 Tax=Leptospira ellisii TaxID=2023197 RepID=A0A2N0B4W5_9LEPT|nr:SDR family oxidoreductase [Leptospira ellisii]MDV6236691.1 SDR family oxidoreductase [Leptospira ellisii]PJZ91533.1 short chain dehydrogenase [Leptospira ellisii]PKA05067.1 short chain dehydrogenase [Leptospira ellisii]
MEKSSKNSVILVTGASDGIGRELCLLYAESGAKLVLAARNQNSLEDLAKECERMGAEALAVRTDVSSPEDCKKLMERAVERFGRIDILINSAGVSMSAPFESLQDLSVFQKLMNVNYLGVVHTSYYALPHLKKSQGLIVNLSSLQGKTGFPRSTGYSASKFAVQGFSDSLRIELMGTGVDVLVVSPGPIATKMNFRKFDANGIIAQEEDSKAAKRNIMSPEECARLIARSISKRERELVMTFGGKLIPWIRLFAPAFVDRMIASAVEKFYSED